MTVERLPLLRSLPLLLLLGGIVTFFILSHPGDAKASRVVVKDGDLYSISDAFGEKRLTTNGDIKILFEHKNAKILFGKGWEGETVDSEGRGGTRLFLMNEDGTNVASVTDSLVTNGFLHPNKKNVFYTTQTLDLFMTDENGKNPKKLMEKADGARLSPDGRFLVYQKMNPNWHVGEYGDQALGLTVFDVQTGAEKRVSDKWEDFAPVWTPDGKKIVFFSASPEGIASLYTMDPDGSNRQQLSNIGQKFVTADTVAIPSEYPVWSPDGKSLLYESDRQIWINVFNSSYSKLLKAKAIAFGRDPAWSENGRDMTVVVTPGSKAKESVIKMNLDGGLLP